MTIKRQILRHLQSGRTLTPLEAFAEYKTMRLARHIHELREEGYPIKTRMKSSMSQTRYAQYYLADTAKERSAAAHG